ncbi:arsenic-transport integral membrane protein ARSC [Mycobacterium tuberculosis]|uniref:Arsenic-transport integral membrane protein ARSC n=1 Tax=Mycobacterium tuberculosis TaxID=1773 RepID=A0A654T845_MYCTX|nr:arsenic-transport integral membrane protein ArsC [Mycobacterium tuberculosis M1374]KCP09877.1 arsenic-transport integral membrane protein ArsC [Mycobacterium tuberculosis BTB09-036]CFE39239.1 arsenic-transport integral membrane protein ARSC [Mycobacterium tuberculosis]COV30534.1 arsenic-transport integral membrane protein ARSC [Mycobacterium tuberculosis]COV42435.1 arsenic-transport integral membrane protein ARSC [Mycobacterium tuberculosis]
MGLITTEPRSSPHPLSPRLVHELGDPHSTLRATTDGSGAALLIHAGGEIDGRNEHLWRQLVTETAAGVTAPGPLIVDVTGLDFMGCCAFAALADEAQRCRCRATIATSPWQIAKSVLIFLGIPLLAGYLSRRIGEKTKGRNWYESRFLPKVGPWALYGLLFTIVILFALQGDQITGRPLDVARIALPLLAYFAIMWVGGYLLGAALRLGYRRTTTLAFTAASNNFELAIAVAIATYGATSGQALAGVVGPLIEVPVLVGLVYVSLALRNRLAGPNATHDADKPSVLFVCVHNAGRSQMAAGLLTHLAGDRIEVRSAGTEPAGQVNPTAVAAMAEMGIDITANAPTLLTGGQVQSSDVVITMGCGDACPYFPGVSYRNWKLPDPAGQPLDVVRMIRDDIADRVQALIAELLATAKTR